MEEPNATSKNRTETPPHPPALLRQNERGHSQYGVKSEHYNVVRDCLLKTIHVTLGDEQYTDEVAGAWEGTLDALTQTMQAGARRDRSS